MCSLFTIVAGVLFQPNAMWVQVCVSMIKLVKKLGRARLSTDFLGKKYGGLRKQKAFVKFGKWFACFMFKHLRKSSSCATSKFWTF